MSDIVTNETEIDLYTELAALEELIEQELETITDSATRLSWHLAIILDKELYKVLRHPEDGAEFTQMDYLERIQDRYSIGVSTAKRNYSAIKFGRTHGLDNPAQISSIGGISQLAKVADAFETDRDGNVMSLKKGALPPGYTATEYAKKALEEFQEIQENALETRHSDRVEAQANILRPGVPKVFIAQMQSGERRWVWELSDRSDPNNPITLRRSGKVSVSLGNDQISIGFHHDEKGLPDEIVDYLYSRLRL